jgi:hypothetical protein
MPAASIFSRSSSISLVWSSPSPLLLNRLHLLAQEVFALVLADLRLDLGLNLRAQLEHLGFLDEEPVEQIETRAHVTVSSTSCFTAVLGSQGSTR